MKKYVLIMLLSMSFFNCNRNPTSDELEEIKKELWVIDKGDKLLEGDVIDFTKGSYCELKGDSIYSNGHFIGQIVKYKKTSRVIEIKSVSGKTSVYYNHDFE